MRENYCGDITSWGKIGLKPVFSLGAAEYAHPPEVLHDSALNLAEKRALLCAWASDACAVNSKPGFRWLPGTRGPILIDHVLTALRTLDQLSGWGGWKVAPDGLLGRNIPQNRQPARGVRT